MNHDNDLLGLVSARQNILSYPRSPVSNISISISNDALTLNKWKETQDKFIYIYRNI